VGNIEFRDEEGRLIDEKLSGIEIIRYALAPLGLELDFRIKLNLKPDTASGLVLDEVTHDTRAFFRERDGKVEIDSCLEVIEKVLTPYNCTLKQVGGMYWIENRREGETPVWHADWALTTITEEANAPAPISLDTYKFKRTSELSMLPPVSEITMRLLNRYMGDNLVDDLNNYWGAGPWDYTGFRPAPSDEQDQIRLTALHIYPDHRTITLKSDFTVEKVTDNDYLSLSFEHKHENMTNMTDFPRLEISVVKPAGTITESTTYAITTDWELYKSPVSNVWKIEALTGDYNIEIKIIATGTGAYSVENLLKNFTLIRIVSEDGETYSDVSFDRFYRARQDGKLKKDTFDVFFGDTPTTGDVAALIYSGDNTTLWNRQGETDEKSLLNVFAIDYLESRADYLDYITLSINDDDNTIKRNNIVSLTREGVTKNYDILNFTKRYRSGFLDVHLRERL